MFTNWCRGVAKMGPVTDTCDICNKQVLDNQDGLLCDKCNNWKHRTCMSMSQRTYIQIGRSKDTWFCGKCKKEAESEVDNKNKQQNKNFTLNDIMAKLELMDQKYNALFAKFQEQEKINERLLSELSTVKKQLNKKEQNELKNNIIVHGVPYMANENIPEIITKIGQTLETPVGKFSAFRMGKEGAKNSAIKVIFDNEDTKKGFLKSKNKFNLGSRDLGYTTDNKVFLNHDLTKANLELFKEAKIFKSNNSFKYLWISNGSILLKKDENSKVIVIENTEQLKN